jgi:glycerol-3-phosphate dehydrogenase
VHFAVEREWALTVDDVLERRTTLAARGLDGGPVRDAVAAVLEAYAPTSARA